MEPVGESIVPKDVVGGIVGKGVRKQGRCSGRQANARRIQKGGRKLWSDVPVPTRTRNEKKEKLKKKRAQEKPGTRYDNGRPLSTLYIAPPREIMESNKIIIKNMKLL